MIDIKEGYAFSKKTSELYKFKYGYDEFPESLYTDCHVGTSYSFTREISADEDYSTSCDCRDFIIDDVSNHGCSCYEDDLEQLEIKNLISMFEKKHYLVVPCIFNYYGSQGCSFSIDDWGYCSDCNDIKCNYLVIVDKDVNHEDDVEIKSCSKQELKKIVINELNLLNSFFNGEVYEINYKRYDFTTHTWNSSESLSNIYCDEQDDTVKVTLGDDFSIIDESEALRLEEVNTPEAISKVITHFKLRVKAVLPLFGGNLRYAIQHVSMVVDKWESDILKMMYGISPYNEEYIDAETAEKMLNIEV